MIAAATPSTTLNGFPRATARDVGVEVLGVGRGPHAGNGGRVVEALCGLLKHLALHGGRLLLAVCSGGTCDRCGMRRTSTTPTWEWHSATHDSPEELLKMWQDAVARSRTAVAELLTDRDQRREASHDRGTVAGAPRRRARAPPAAGVGAAASRLRAMRAHRGVRTRSRASATRTRGSGSQ